MPTDSQALGAKRLGALNLALKFGLELVALASFAYWGANVSTGIVAVLLALAAPTAAAFLWATFAAPRANRRLALHFRVPFELGVFALAAIALLTYSSAAAVVFVLVVAINSVLLTLLSQWEG